MLKLGLIGNDLAHSGLPPVHQEIMKRNNISGKYDMIEVSEDELEAKIKELKKTYRGVNIDGPYKETVLPLLDELDGIVEYVGAANTVLFKGNKAIGYNTDYYGFTSTLNDNNITVKGMNATVLGSGGTAKAVAKALLDQGVYDLTLVTRNKQIFHNLYSTSYEFYTESTPECDIIINCTPSGQYPDTDTSPLPQKAIRAPIVIDLIYNPKKTLFLSYAEKNGAQIINGHHMLVKQALKSYKIWG